MERSVARVIIRLSKHQDIPVMARTGDNEDGGYS